MKLFLKIHSVITLRARFTLFAVCLFLAQGALVQAQSVATQTTSTADLIGRGYAAIAGKRLDDAEQLLLKAKSQSPRDLYVLLNLGVVYHRKNQADLAKKYYQEVITISGEIDPASVEKAVLSSAVAGVNSKPAAIATHNLSLIK